MTLDHACILEIPIVLEGRQSLSFQRVMVDGNPHWEKPRQISL